MKKSFIYLAGFLSILCGCAKEIELNQEQEDKVTPTEEVKTYIIRASINQDTKTTVTDLGIYSWSNDERIGVADGTTSKKGFSIDNEQKDAGVFKYAGSDIEGELRFAVSPYNVMTVPAASGNDVTINLPTSYTAAAGTTNAIMIAGAPSIDGDEHVFAFRHAMSLIKFTYANAPVGTKSFRLTMDQNISGASVTVDATSNPEIKISDLTGGEVSKSTTINLPSAITAKNTTVSFYVPVPTGTYKTFKAELLNVGGVVLKTNNKALGGDGLTLGKADLFITPTITLPAASDTETFSLVTDKYDMVNGQYIILAKEKSTSLAYDYFVSTTTGGSTRPSNADQSIFNGTSTTVTSSAVGDEMRFTFTGSGDTWTIQNSDGNYLYATANNDGLRVNTTSDTWTISQHPTDDDYLCFKENNNDRFLGITADLSGAGWRSYTDANQSNYNTTGSQIVLYYCGTLVPKAKLNAPTEVIAALNTDDDDVTNTIDVVWDDALNAASDVACYEIILVPTSSGETVSYRTNASETSAKSASVTDLAYETEYEISVKAISANYENYKDSDASTITTDSTAETDKRPASLKQLVITNASFPSLTGSVTATEHTVTVNTVTITGSGLANNNNGTPSGVFKEQILIIGTKSTQGNIWNTTAVDITSFKVYYTKDPSNLTVSMGSTSDGLSATSESAASTTTQTFDGYNKSDKDKPTGTTNVTVYVKTYTVPSGTKFFKISDTAQNQIWKIEVN